MIVRKSQKISMLNLKPKYIEQINETKSNNDLFKYPIIGEQHKKH